MLLKKTFPILKSQIYFIIFNFYKSLQFYLLDFSLQATGIIFNIESDMDLQFS